MQVGYFVRETTGNLWRNWVVTVASILTIGVTLAMVGAGIIVHKGVVNATRRWQGGIEFVIFMQPTANQDQIDAVTKELKSNPAVVRYTYFNKDKAYAELKDLFRNQPEFYKNTDKSILPTSFRVVPVNKQAKAVEDLGAKFANSSGVYRVVFSSETIAAVQTLAGKVNRMILFLAAVLGIAAMLLIFTTVQIAVFARRREIEVMKLVGATNWFIRVPFMLEGLVQGVFGAIVAVTVSILFNQFFLTDLFPSTIPLVQGFGVDLNQLVGSFVLVLGGGAALGAVAAGVAVTWFMDV
jgi:cell division transport system permease protein